MLVDGKALLKLAPPSDLLKARDEKRALALAKQAKKDAAKEAERLRHLARLEKGKLAPTDMFKPPHVKDGEYGEWDESGMPVKDGEGKELSKNLRKRLGKEYESQKKLHEEYLREGGSQG